MFTARKERPRLTEPEDPGGCDTGPGPAGERRGVVGRAEKWNPGAGRRRMSVVGTVEKEPRVLVASSAGQEPAGGGGPWLQKASEAAGIEFCVGLQSPWWLCGSMCRARFRGVLSAEMDGAW